MSEQPPSSMLLQAADLPLSELPLLTTSQFLSGLLLLMLSAAFKAVVRAMDQDASVIAAGDASRHRLAARLAQYLALTAGTVVLTAPAGSTGRVLILLGVVFFVYLVLLLVGRMVAGMAPVRLLLVMRVPLRAWSLLAAPLVAVSYRADAWVQRRSYDAASEDTGERLSAWLDSSGLSGDELSLIHNALRFRERSLGELMVPRPDVAWLSTNDDPERILQQVRDSGHSRFPLCLDSPDQVIGYVHVRDLGLLRTAPSSQELRAAARPVSFVPETAEAMTLLRRFQREQSHMAVVVDEFGGTAGIVTLEDLLEELVGEIRDEFDEEEVEITPLRNGQVLLDGAVRLEELERGYQLDFGDVEEETVGGYVFGRLAREVTAGDEVGVGDAVLRVEGVQGLRVTRVRLIPAVTPEPA
ncbi:MAG: hemolysin family protein [Trueperaceae bacterium]